MEMENFWKRLTKGLHFKRQSLGRNETKNKRNATVKGHYSKELPLFCVQPTPPPLHLPTPLLFLHRPDKFNFSA